MSNPMEPQEGSSTASPQQEGESPMDYCKKISDLLDKHVALAKATTDHGPDISMSPKDIRWVRELLQKLSNSPILVANMFHILGADLNRVDPPVKIHTTEMRTKDIWLLGYLLSDHLDNTRLKMAVVEELEENPDVEETAQGSPNIRDVVENLRESIDYGNDIEYLKLFLRDISKRLGEHYAAAPNPSVDPLP